jgi:hypothetical protein
MSNSTEAYDYYSFKHAKGKKNIRLCKDFLYVVDVFRKQQGKDENSDDIDDGKRDLYIYADLNEGVKKYEDMIEYLDRGEIDKLGVTDAPNDSTWDIEVKLVQSYYYYNNKQLTRLLELRSKSNSFTVHHLTKPE